MQSGVKAPPQGSLSLKQAGAMAGEARCRVPSNATARQMASRVLLGPWDKNGRGVVAPMAAMKGCTGAACAWARAWKPTALEAASGLYLGPEPASQPASQPAAPVGQVCPWFPPPPALLLAPSPSLGPALPCPALWRAAGGGMPEGGFLLEGGWGRLSQSGRCGCPEAGDVNWGAAWGRGGEVAVCP